MNDILLSASMVIFIANMGYFHLHRYEGLRMANCVKTFRLVVVVVVVGGRTSKLKLLN